MSDDGRRCENLACLCEVTSANTACGDYCASPEARDPHEIVCTCGHDVCAKTTAEQLHGGVGRESPN
jgi:hypothetical protein